MQIFSRSIAQAIQLSETIYELILTNWGNRGVKQDPNNGSILFPATPSNANGSIPLHGQDPAFSVPSLSGIAVSPRSGVDRCIIRYGTRQVEPQQSQLPPTSTVNNGFVNQGGILETEQIVSIHSHLIGPQIGPIFVRAHPSSWFGDTYQLSGGGSGAFGTALPSTSNWNPPELRLLLYLASSRAFPPNIRAPYYYETIYTFTAATEQIVAVVPIGGRRRVKVAVKAGNTASIAVRLTGTFHTLQPLLGSSPFATQNDQEVELLDSSTVDANQGILLSVDDPEVSFLLIKATTSIGQTMALNVSATD